MLNTKLKNYVVNGLKSYNNIVLISNDDRNYRDLNGLLNLLVDEYIDLNKEDFIDYKNVDTDSIILDLKKSILLADLL
ncbi:MAG: hypothetical protein LBC06_01050 [Rickettsiales bacterium]|nr:hypothetical protein [Rickettsiales bacterium]